jgi:hypothetical protein
MASRWPITRDRGRGVSAASLAPALVPIRALVVAQRCRLVSDWGSDPRSGPGTLASSSRTCGGTACDNSWPLPARAPPVIPQSPGQAAKSEQDATAWSRCGQLLDVRIESIGRRVCSSRQRIAGCPCGTVTSGLGSCRLVATPLAARTAQPQVAPSNNSPLTGNRHAYTGFERRFVIRVGGIRILPRGWGS